MIVSKFTPGPWAVYGDWGIEDSSGRLIAQYEPLCSGIDLGNTKESFANARLITAAPDLYEALDKLKSSYEALAHDYEYAVGAGDIHPLHAEHIQRCAAALAKARGENQ